MELSLKARYLCCMLPIWYLLMRLIQNDLELFLGELSTASVTVESSQF